jgi:hypothetical protein
MTTGASTRKAISRIVACPPVSVARDRAQLVVFAMESRLTPRGREPGESRQRQ